MPQNIPLHASPEIFKKGKKVLEGLYGDVHWKKNWIEYGKNSWTLESLGYWWNNL